jgi:hypothetical protein
MVQVCSAEIFSLPPDVTAHVTYKTTLTRRGVWALTVGIVDPGWEAPISTTLLNFSKVPYSLKAGDPFLRASFFQHDPVEPKHLRESPDPDEYRTSVQKDAAMLFPKTFLDRDAIAKSAGDAVLKKVRDEAFAWVAGIALLFALIQIAAGYLQPAYNAKPSEYDLNILQKELTTLRDKVKELESPTVRKDQTP